MKDTNVAPAGGKKYSFVGRPDFGRIIRENGGADVIIVSREDGLVSFLFRIGTDTPHRTTLDRVSEQARLSYRFETSKYMASNSETLPDGWVQHSSSNPEKIKDLRKVAQLFVRARTDKHTVEVLP